MQQVAHRPVPYGKKTISPTNGTRPDRWTRRAVSWQVYLAVSLALPLSAQGWVPNRLAPDLRDLHSPIAFDTLRGRLVMCSERTVWEWKSGEWWRRAGPAMPADPWRIEECAYDSVRHRLVVFGGGRGNVIMNETWEYDGVDWVRKSPLQSPPVRLAHAMAFDPGRGRVVLFGGSPDGVSATPALGDLWEWDGTQWQQRVTTGGPSPRFNAAAAYDSVRRRIVIHGGLANTTQLTDTWEWDGTTWSLRSNAGPASNAARLSAAFDVARAVMVVATQGPGGQVATWEWNGTTWSDKTTPGWSYSWPRLVYDSVRQRVVLSAQRPYGGFEVRLWDGAAWSTVDEQVPPSLFLTSSLVWDSRRNLVVSMTPWTSGVVFFMAEWNGSQWREFIPTQTPAPRRTIAAAFDAARGQIVLFGGLQGSVILADTWLSDGTNWHEAVVPGPSARWDHGMTCDSARQRVVLFGGEGPGVSYLNDTWEWDGVQWSQRPSTTAPSARKGHRLAYDGHRQRVVLFGGAAGSARLADTWEWDGSGGSGWTMQTPSNSPPPRYDHAMGYDAGRRRVVIYGGLARQTNSPLNDSWEWDGTAWTPIGGSLPEVTGARAMTYDPTRERLLLHGSANAIGGRSQLWTLSPGGAALVEPYGLGCGAPTAPALRAAGAPTLGRAQFGIEVLRANANAACVLLAGLAPTDLRLNAACAVKVDPATIVLTVPTGTDGDGFAFWPMPVPRTPALAGVALFAQAAVANGSGAFAGFDLTDGLRLVISD